MNVTIGPEVQVEAGIVRGVPRDEREVLAFKGIPYAARRASTDGLSLPGRPLAYASY